MSSTGHTIALLCWPFLGGAECDRSSGLRGHVPTAVPPLHKMCPWSHKAVWGPALVDLKVFMSSESVVFEALWTAKANPTYYMGLFLTKYINHCTFQNGRDPS